MERSALLLHYGTCITFCHYNLHTNIDKVSTDTIVIMSDSSNCSLAFWLDHRMQTFPLCTLTQYPNSIIISGS